MNKHSIGIYLHGLATSLWPIARSITGFGVRQTLEILDNESALKNPQPSDLAA